MYWCDIFYLCKAVRFVKDRREKELWIDSKEMSFSLYIIFDCSQMKLPYNAAGYNTPSSCSI
jgi:hypothetical protein